jgi:putative flippase GtrA
LKGARFLDASERRREVDENAPRRDVAIVSDMRDPEVVYHPPLSARVIFIRYVAFAMVAGLTNIGAQEIFVRALPLAPIMASILSGTVLGFFVKYLLEKRWVFFDEYGGHVAETRKFILYGVLGVGTTALFWVTELGFWYSLQTTEAKYIGAAIGLALANWIKFHLSKRYVFRPSFP